MRRLSITLCAAMLVSVFATPKDSEACGRIIERKINPQLRDVRRAEHLLAQGKFDRAARLAKKAFPKVVQLSPSEKPRTLFDRAQRVVALAAVRTDGKINLGRAGMRGRKDADLGRNLMWATLALQYQQARYGDNVVIRSQYAEALTMQPVFRPAAYEILVDLANVDVMPTARGYALLARLQQERGDTNGRDLSLTRCSAISGAEETCRVA